MKPFLKWLGNKHRLFNHLAPHLPEGRRLIEPFTGSGAVFLNTHYNRYLLGEQNKDLVLLYQLLQTEPERFIKYAKKFFRPENNCEDIYYQFREKFNNTKSKKLRAALFLYLNKHGYNGLCRYNQSGKFNVPFGRYVKPYFPEEEMNYFHLKAKNATFIHGDYKSTLNKAKAGDVVYCDPPYVPLSKSANFTSYTKKGFCDNEQRHLAMLAEALANKGTTVIISNHDTPETRHYYRIAALHTIPARRFISCDPKRRKKLNELLAIFTPT